MSGTCICGHSGGLHFKFGVPPGGTGCTVMDCNCIAFTEAEAKP